MKIMINLNLLNLREVHKYTQEEVAEKINVSRQAVAKWESGKSLPDINNCIALSQLYNVSLDTLVNYEQTDGTPPLPPPKGKHAFGTVTVGERGQIVLPKKSREVFNIKPGDTLMVLGDENQGGLALIDAKLFISNFEFIKKAAGLKSSIKSNNGEEND